MNRVNGGFVSGYEKDFGASNKRWTLHKIWIKSDRSSSVHMTISAGFYAQKIGEKDAITIILLDCHAVCLCHFRYVFSGTVQAPKQVQP